MPSGGHEGGTFYLLISPHITHRGARLVSLNREFKSTQLRLINSLEMGTIYALVVFGSSLAILAVISIASIPGWRLTRGNILLFVFGGFLGIFILPNLLLWIWRHFLSLRVREIPHGEWVGYAAMLIGAELGGLGLIMLKTRLSKRGG